MSGPCTFTPEQDAAILDLRQRGRSWYTVAEAVGHSRNAVSRHWARLQQLEREGAPAPVPTTRGPLSPGDPITWEAITAGMCIEGSAYR